MAQAVEATDQLGTKNAARASALDEIAVLYASFDENDMAASLFQRAIEIHIQLLGANHLDVAQSYSRFWANSDWPP